MKNAASPFKARHFRRILHHVLSRPHGDIDVSRDPRLKLPMWQLSFRFEQQLADSLKVGLRCSFFFLEYITRWSEFFVDLSRDHVQRSRDCLCLFLCQLFHSFFTLSLATAVKTWRCIQWRL